MTMMTLLMVMVVVEVFCKVSTEILLWLPLGDFYTISDWLVQRRCLAGTSVVFFFSPGFTWFPFDLFQPKLQIFQKQISQQLFGEAFGCRYFPNRFCWKSTNSYVPHKKKLRKPLSIGITSMQFRAVLMTWGWGESCLKGKKGGGFNSNRCQQCFL